MSSSVKIRLLLLLLTLCFAGTAVTINLTYKANEILLIDGKTVEKNLHKKEQIVIDALSNDKIFERLKLIDDDQWLKGYVLELSEEKGIYLYTYSNNDLVFWGSDQIVPRSDAGIAEGSSIINWSNGWYEAYKRSSGGFSVVCLIPIKATYPIANRFLDNDFHNDLIDNSNLEIASFNDKAVYNLRNVEGNYLLSLKLKSNNFNTVYSNVELIMWLLAGLMLTVFVHILCLYISKRGWVKLSILIFAAFLLLFRYINLETNWFANNFFSGFFDPRVFASSFILPSLGALVFHVLSATWLVCYIYHCRHHLLIVRKTSSAFGQLSVYLICAAILYYLSFLATNIFERLVLDSSISFEVNNLLNLSAYSWVGILLLAFVVFTFYLVIDILLIQIKALEIPKKKELFWFFVTVAIFLLFQVFMGSLTLSFFLFVTIIYLKGWGADPTKGFNLAVFVALLFLFAGISSIGQSTFERRKLQDKQLLALQRLETSDDPHAVLLFLDVEKEIPKESSLINYFTVNSFRDSQALNENLRKTYFGGYLSKYDFTGTFISVDSSANTRSDLAKLQRYKDKVISGSRKVSANFYRLNDNIGYINYFALLPIRNENSDMVGTYLVELKNKSLGRLGSYPEILVNGTVESPGHYENYSYAYYRDNKLMGQHGAFLYPIEPDDYPTDIRRYIQFTDDQGYNHIMFRPNEKDLLILSEKLESGWRQLATLSFLFLVFLTFAILLNFVQWLSVLLNDYDFNFRNFRWSVMILQNRILYSTRIQAFVVLAVIGTLVIAGIITFFSLVEQYRIQQENVAIKRVSQIARGLEPRLSDDPFEITEIKNEEEFDIASDINASDLNLYDNAGNLVYTTQRQIYDLGLISRYMNSKAWLNLKDYSREEFIHREKIGQLSFLVAYTPLKNEKDETIAYLSLPYFSNQKELDQQIGLLLNTIINVYALVLVALGLFAVFVANKITAPLTLVQKSLARTTIGKKNEPIFWKRNDEIGSLIKEYNNMIVALDNSANRIMRSERESAWREMAKQVAHEIKNPLTPLRLGVQLLDRAWREKDPRFDEKFDRFSKSFIEQIESLNHIASEFANFAKMPDTRLDDVEIIDVIEKSISIYNDNPNLSIEFNTSITDHVIVHGDRDQLLRTFNNLIKNAIEARLSGQKGVVSVSAELKDKEHILIIVKDSGTGIDELLQHKIFQPNFTTKSSGTGLGLAFVKQTVESLGGTISFKTYKGFGTTFYIVLPLKLRAPKA